jgi:hypothetical protein
VTLVNADDRYKTLPEYAHDGFSIWNDGLHYVYTVEIFILCNIKREQSVSVISCSSCVSATVHKLDACAYGKAETVETVSGTFMLKNIQDYEYFHEICQ